MADPTKIYRAAYSYGNTIYLNLSAWVLSDDKDELEAAILAVGDEHYNGDPLETVTIYPTILGWEELTFNAEATPENILDGINDVMDKCEDIFEHITE